MGAHARYPAAHEQLRELAVRARREGLSFDAFWERAVRPKATPVTWNMPPDERPAGAVVWPSDSQDRATSRGATLGAKAAWKRAYNRAPATRADRAAAHLVGAIDET